MYHSTGLLHSNVFWVRKWMYRRRGGWRLYQEWANSSCYNQGKVFLCTYGHCQGFAWGKVRWVPPPVPAPHPRNSHHSSTLPIIFGTRWQQGWAGGSDPALAAHLCKDELPCHHHRSSQFSVGPRLFLCVSLFVCLNCACMCIYMCIYTCKRGAKSAFPQLHLLRESQLFVFGCVQMIISGAVGDTTLSMVWWDYRQSIFSNLIYTCASIMKGSGMSIWLSPPLPSGADRAWAKQPYCVLHIWTARIHQQDYLWVTPDMKVRKILLQSHSDKAWKSRVPHMRKNIWLARLCLSASACEESNPMI